MQNAFDASLPSFRNHGASIVLGIACMHHYRAGDFLCQRQLFRECATLLETR
jgi:hypothetical protein